MNDKEKIYNMASCMLSILDSLMLYDNDSLLLDNETLSEVMFRKMKFYNIDLNKELGITHLKPINKHKIMNKEKIKLLKYDKEIIVDELLRVIKELEEQDLEIKELIRQLNLTDVSSMFSAEQMEKAFNDGAEAEQQRCCEFDIENY